MKPLPPELLHNPLLWRGDQLARIEHAVPSGFADLDDELPGGGWPQGALTELLLNEEGIGELRLLLPALQRLAQSGEWIALVAPPHIPYAPAFAAAGIDPARIIVIETAEDNNQWWAAEQVLRANSVGALLFWPGNDHRLDSRLRRLQLAAQDGDALAFVFTGAARISQPSPSPLRIRLSLASAGLRLDVFKRRGGVVSRPLFLGVTAMLSSHPFRRQHDATALQLLKKLIKPQEQLDRHPTHRRTIHFNRIYPAGAPPAQIWNRALARADEGRRVPGSDPREKRDTRTDHSFIVPLTRE